MPAPVDSGDPVILLTFLSCPKHQPPGRRPRVRADRRHHLSASALSHHSRRGLPAAARRSTSRNVGSPTSDGREAAGGIGGSAAAAAAPRLDELLDELQVRLQAVLSTRDRVYSLLEAVVAVGSSLELEVLLRSIVETAVSLVDARYGAMGVIEDGGGLAEFIPVGLDDRRDRGDPSLARGKGAARLAGHRAPAVAPGRYQGPRGVIRLPAWPSSDEVVSRSADPDSRRGLRQPLPDREARRRPVRHRGRSGPGRARCGGGRRDRERQALRRGAPTAALAERDGRGHQPPAVRRRTR